MAPSNFLSGYKKRLTRILRQIYNAFRYNLTHSESHPIKQARIERACSNLGRKFIPDRG